MTDQEIKQMVEDEEQRLGVGSKKFMKRHNEIMQLIEHAREGVILDGETGIQGERPL